VTSPSHAPPPPPPDTPIAVLAEGPTWLAIDKPAGLLVHRSALAPDTDVLIDRLRLQLDQVVHPVHRLDRPTSGVLLLARTAADVPALQDALRDGRKSYLALVRGRADRAHGTLIDRPLTPEGGGDPKDARTRVEVLASCEDPRCSLVLAQPETGRYHQVRRHLRGLDHPVLGDSTHGDIRQNRVWRERGLLRLALHCARLELVIDGQPMDAIAPLPDDLGDVLRALPLYVLAVERAPHLLGHGRNGVA
jgi:tRNA pseudouridine65 synthase